MRALRSTENTLAPEDLRRGATEIVERPLAAGDDPNVGSADGTTPLIYAARAGGRDTVEALLAAGANPSRSRDGITALMAAESAGMPK